MTQPNMLWRNLRPTQILLNYSGLLIVYFPSAGSSQKREPLDMRIRLVLDDIVSHIKCIM